MATDEMAETKSADRTVALGMSTLAFTVCFAVWTIFSIIGVQIKKDLGLTDTQFGLLIGTPILTGSLIRLILGIWADQYGGRLVYVAVMVAAAAATRLLTYAYDYLGAGPETLATITRHSFGDAMRHAERPLILVGAQVFARTDGAAVAALAAKAAIDLGAVKEGWNGYSVLQGAASRVGASFW